MPSTPVWRGCLARVIACPGPPFTASFASMISSSVIFGLSGVTSQPARLGLALLSPLAFSQALSTVVELEIQGLGLGIDTIFDSAGTGFNFLRGIEMLIVDWFFYLFLAWYLGQVAALLSRSIPPLPLPFFP